MKSWFGCVSFLLLLVMGGCVFVTAQRMHAAQNEVQQLNHDIAQEQDHLRVLQAEWTYLNNPERLEKLAADFGLQPLDGKQYVALANVPTQTAMQDIETAQADKANAKNALRQQQLAAAAQPANPQKVDQALALAAAEAQPAALPATVNVALTSDGVE